MRFPAAQLFQLRQVHINFEQGTQAAQDVVIGTVILGDAHLVVVAGHKGVHRGHGAHTEHLDIGVFVVGDGDQGHADGRALAAAAAVAGELDAVAFQGVAHFRAGIDAGDAPFQVGGRRAVDAFYGDGLPDAQRGDGREKGGGVDVQPEPGFLAQEHDEAVADFVEGVLPAHGRAGQPLVESGGGPEGVVGAGHLEGVAHPVHIIGQLPDLPRVVFLNEVAGQAAGNAAAVGPLPAPAGDEVVGRGVVGEGEKSLLLFVGHNGPPCRRAGCAW